MINPINGEKHRRQRNPDGYGWNGLTLAKTKYYKGRTMRLHLTLRDKVLRENINVYLHFMSFLHTSKTQVVEIPPRVGQGTAYST